MIADSACGGVVISRGGDVGVGGGAQRSQREDVRTGHKAYGAARGSLC